MNCPTCGQKDVTRQCPACGEILEPEPLDLVAVKSFDNAPEAHAARAYLEAEGIRAFVSGGQIAGMLSPLGSVIGSVKVEVPFDDVEAATEILQTAKLRPVSLDDSTCLACGQPMSETETTCRACGWTFADSESTDGVPAEPSGDSESGMHWLWTVKLAFVVVLLILVFWGGLSMLIVTVGRLEETVQSPLAAALFVAFLLMIAGAALLLLRWLTTSRNK